MTDLLSSIKDFLVEETEVNNIAIIPHVELMPLEREFPAIGILDGGDKNLPGASEGIRKHFVYIAAYSLIVGDREPAVLEVRNILETVKTLLENQENFTGTGPFAGFNGCTYLDSCESRSMKYGRDEDEKNFVVIKLFKFEFKETYISI